MPGAPIELAQRSSTDHFELPYFRAFLEIMTTPAVRQAPAKSTSLDASPPVNGSDPPLLGVALGVMSPDVGVVDPFDATVVLETAVLPSEKTLVVVVDSGTLVVSPCTKVLVVVGASVVVVVGATVVAVVTVVVGPCVVVVVGASVVVVVGASVVVVVGADVVVVEVDVLVDVDVVVDVDVEVVVDGTVEVVVVVDVVVPVPPVHTWVRLNCAPTGPLFTCAVALSNVSVNGTCTLANLSFANTTPATVPAVWKVAKMLTNPSPEESGSTKIHPGPCPQFCVTVVPTTGTFPGLIVAGVDAPAPVTDVANAATSANEPNVTAPATKRARRRLMLTIWGPPSPISASPHCLINCLRKE
jgi:hypothetical protein